MREETWPLDPIADAYRVQAVEAGRSARFWEERHDMMRARVVELSKELAAARRAGAEEMRERCEVACNDLAERQDERYLRGVNNATREDANVRAAAFREAVREIRALHPDAKGGDHA